MNIPTKVGFAIGGALTGYDWHGPDTAVRIWQ